MVSIVEWLQGLGLERYAQSFLAGDIDMDTLRDLSEADFQTLGVSLGHRKRLLRATAALELGGETGSDPPEPPPMPPPPEAQPERRQLSMAYCDLVGSTALAASLDPEDAREVMLAYQRCCAEVVERFGGSISAMQGDGIMIRFGYPVAHEDDVERAVACGLDLVAAVDKLRTGQELTLQARVGIASGPVVVGDRLVATNEQGTSGSAPNLAARLQSVAEPGQVVIDALTCRLVGGAFTTTQTGPHVLKGFAEPVPAWIVHSARPSDSRFAARHIEAPTVLIGREHELGLLLHRWQEAVAGEGQVVLLSGEPGYGKSRLVAALLEELPDHVFKPIWQCSPYRTNTALYPVIENLSRAAGLLAADTPDVKREKLQRLLGSNADLPVFAELLSIPAREHDGRGSLTPEERKRQVFAALLARLRALTEQGPVCFVVEDMHWIDPTTLELIDVAVDIAQRAPLLLILTFRPEFSARYGRSGHVTTLTLNRMSKGDSVRLSTLVAGSDQLPSAIRERIVERAEGVPLFIEELTRSTLETGMIDKLGAGLGASPVWTAELIPSSLQSSLVSRLDRLSAVKEIAQIASVIGREFGRDLLMAVAEYDPSTLDRALESLIAAEIVHRVGGIAAQNYAFRHTLIQDAAYGSLLRAKRRLFHLRIADVIEAQFAERAATEPEVIAHHLTEAGETERAIAYWLQAAAQASERSASREALAHTERGLQLLATLPPSPKRDREESRIVASRLVPSLFVFGFSSDEVDKIYRRLRALHQEGDDPKTLSLALYGEYLISVTQGEIRHAIEVAEIWLNETRFLEDRNPFYHALRCRAYMLFMQGDLAKAGAELESLAKVDWEHDGYSHGDYSAAVAQAIQNMYSALTLWCTGFPDQADAAAKEALRLGQMSGRVDPQAFLKHTWSVLLLMQGDDANLAAVAQALITAGGQHQHSYSMVGRAINGILAVRAGDFEGGAPVLTDSFATMDRMKYRFMRPLYLCWLAEAKAGLGRLEAGLQVLDEADAVIGHGGEEVFSAVVANTRGRLCLRHEDAAAAERAFADARAIAARQGARMFEIEAATHLAGIWRNSGRSQEAAALLEPLLAALPEGPRAEPIRRARLMLAELRSSSARE